MPSFKLDEDIPIRVELTPAMGTETESLPLEEQSAETSAAAINNAMNAMRNMAQLVVETLETLPRQPSQVDVAFGIKLDLDGNATLVKAGNDSVIDVKLVWEGEWLQNVPISEHEETEKSESPGPARVMPADDAPAEYRQAVVDPPDWEDDDEDWV